MSSAVADTRSPTGSGTARPAFTTTEPDTTTHTSADSSARIHLAWMATTGRISIHMPSTIPSFSPTHSARPPCHQPRRVLRRRRVDRGLCPVSRGPRFLRWTSCGRRRCARTMRSAPPVSTRYRSGVLRHSSQLPCREREFASEARPSRRNSTTTRDNSRRSALRPLRRAGVGSAFARSGLPAA
jgi:hypothetical protein